MAHSEIPSETLPDAVIDTMPEAEPRSPEGLTQDDLYQRAASDYGAALDRLARAYEFDHDKRRDLLQEVHVALWRSFANFEGRCSLRTWVYRVAHNAAASHATHNRRLRARELVSIDVLETLPDESSGDQAMDRERNLKRLLLLVQRLKPLDRQIMLLYLEGEDAAAIGEITGASAGNVATKIHRIKAVLARRFHQGDAS